MSFFVSIPESAGYTALRPLKTAGFTRVIRSGYSVIPQIDTKKLIQFKQLTRNTGQIGRCEVNVDRYPTIHHSLLDI